MSLSTLADTPEMRARVRGVIAARYAAPLYERVEQSSITASIEVCMWATGGALYVSDAPLHEALSWQLEAELGATYARRSNGSPRPAYVESWVELSPGDLMERWRFEVLPAGQIAAFDSFRTEVAGFIGGFFPIRAAARVIELGKVKMDAPPAPPASSRCAIRAQLRLLDGATEVEAKTVALCNIFAPSVSGRGLEPGREGRPFDEYELGLRRSIGRLLETDLRKKLSTTPRAKLKLAWLLEP